MSFELVVSAQRDPRAARRASAHEGSQGASHATVGLNGTFDESAAQAVLQSVSDLCRDGARSIAVEMQDVEPADAVCLQSFAGSLMALRGAGVHVQVCARHERLHRQLEKLPDARDWLLAFAKTDISTARVAIHVDGLNKTD